MNPKTESRKLDHVNICTQYNVEAQEKSTLFENVELIHNALPELNKEEIDLSINLFGKKLNAPLIITGMTGGHEVALEINKNLAKGAQELGIGFGLGSQRAMLENKELEYTYKVRDIAPDILLIGNLGMPQIKKFGSKIVQHAAEKAQVDVFAIHLNNLQEVVQVEGDISTKGFLKLLEETVKVSKVPILAKETGAGISREAAQNLLKVNVAGIDTGGAGGTSFAAVEVLRSKRKNMLEFWDWGIPTAASILEVRSVSQEITLIATGGIRTGIDVAKALALGADAVGIGLPLLKPAKIGAEKVILKLSEILEQLKVAMFLTGSSTIEELKNNKITIFGRLAEWKNKRNLKTRMEWES